MSDYSDLRRSGSTVEFTLAVDDQFGRSVWDVSFSISEAEKSAFFDMDQANHARVGATSPDDRMVGWLTWAAGERLVVAFGGPYIGYAGWLVLPMNGPEEDGEDEWWLALARELLARIALIDQPDNPLRLNADADRSREPQGRAYNAE